MTKQFHFDRYRAPFMHGWGFLFPCLHLLTLEFQFRSSDLRSQTDEYFASIFHSQTTTHTSQFYRRFWLWPGFDWGTVLQSIMDWQVRWLFRQFVLVFIQGVGWQDCQSNLRQLFIAGLTSDSTNWHPRRCVGMLQQIFGIPENKLEPWFAVRLSD